MTSLRPDQCGAALAYVDDAIAQTRKSIAEYESAIANGKLQIAQLEALRHVVMTANAREMANA